MLLSVPPRYGLPRALWRDGGPVEAALAVQPAVSLPGFDGPVHAVPLLTAEAQRLAADTGAAQLRAYSVFPGRGCRTPSRPPGRRATRWRTSTPSSPPPTPTWPRTASPSPCSRRRATPTGPAARCCGPPTRSR
nr:hypothetical protein [Pseudonocardia sp. AL041005-10]